MWWRRKAERAQSLSLRDKLAQAIYRGPLGIEDPEFPAWEELSKKDRQVYYAVADQLKNPIVSWANDLLTNSVAAAYAEGIQLGWIAAGGDPNMPAEVVLAKAIPDEEDGPC